MAEKPLLILMRGLPGSGKSTLARILRLVTSTSNSSATTSADDFFVDKSGNYTFLPHLLSKAHEWCQGKTKKAMMDTKTKLVIVDNTNTQVRLKKHLQTEEFQNKMYVRYCNS